MGRTVSKWLAATSFVFLVGVATFLVLALWPIQEHRRWHERASAGIYALAGMRPADVPPGQWEFMVGWTMNLHGNWGAHHTYVDPDQKWAYLDELERRLQGPVDVATIDWIWDEYARITKGGRGYGERYRPTHSPGLKSAQPGGWGLWVR